MRLMTVFIRPATVISFLKAVRGASKGGWPNLRKTLRKGRMSLPFIASYAFDWV